MILREYFKLINTAFFGKTMEDKRGHVDIKFCLTESQFVKHTSSALFANNITQLGETFLVQKHKKIVELDQSIYVGVAILELSKLKMFQAFYDVVRVEFPKCRMLKTDTDSLLIEVKTHDLYKDFKNSALIQEHFEFSNYPKDHYLYNCDRVKHLGRSLSRRNCEAEIRANYDFRVRWSTRKVLFESDIQLYKETI